MATRIVGLQPELHEQKILDHGYVRYIDHMGTDETIVEAARMSTGRGFVSWEPYERCKKCHSTFTTQGPSGAMIAIQYIERSADFTCHHKQTEKFPRGDFGLLEYLYSNGHTTPFEMAELAIQCDAPIFDWRQWHRHRTQSFNEESGRYGPLRDLFHVPSMDRLRDSTKASKNKQAAGTGRAIDDVALLLEQDMIRQEQRVLRRGYERRLALGIAPELARVNDPVSQYSACRAKTDLHNWLGFLRLRLNPHAQHEIRVYAEAVANIIKELWPKTWQLFEEYTLYGLRLSRKERALLYDLLERVDDRSGFDVTAVDKLCYKLKEMGTTK